MRFCVEVLCSDSNWQFRYGFLDNSTTVQKEWNIGLIIYWTFIFHNMYYVYSPKEEKTNIGHQAVHAAPIAHAPRTTLPRASPHSPPRRWSPWCCPPRWCACTRPSRLPCPQAQLQCCWCCWVSLGLHPAFETVCETIKGVQHPYGHSLTAHPRLQIPPVPPVHHRPWGVRRRAGGEVHHPADLLHLPGHWANLAQAVLHRV